MAKNDEPKEYYIETEDEKITISEEVYRAYYRPVWATQKRKERERRCRNADGSRCTNDCELCEREPDGGILSLDTLTEGGYEAADSVDVEELVMEKLLLDELYAALDELTADERSLIVDLYFNGQSERKLSKESGIPHPTIHSQKNAILKKLKSLLEKI